MIKYYYSSAGFSSVGIAIDNTGLEKLVKSHGSELPYNEMFILGETTVSYIAIPIACYQNVIRLLKHSPTRVSLNNPDKIYISKNVAFPRRKLKYFPKDVQLDIAKSINTADTLIIDTKSYIDLCNDLEKYRRATYVLKYGDPNDPKVIPISIPINLIGASECYHLDKASARDNLTKQSVGEMLDKTHPSWLTLDLCAYNSFGLTGVYKDTFDVINCGKPTVDKEILMTALGSGAMDYSSFMVAKSTLTKCMENYDVTQFNIVLDSISSYNRKESRFYLSWLYYTVLQHNRVTLNTNNKAFLKYLEDDNRLLTNAYRSGRPQEQPLAILAFMKRSIDSGEDFKVPMSMIIEQFKNNGYDLANAIMDLKILGEIKVDFKLKEELKNKIYIDLVIPENFHEYF